MKKLLLFFAWIVSVSLSALAADDIWILAAQTTFPESGSYNYSLIHQEGTNGTTFTTLPYSHSNWSGTTDVTVTKKATMVYSASRNAFETVGFEKGSEEGKYKMYFKNATNNKYYFTGIDANGYIQTPSSSSSRAVEVEVKFKYSADGTVHYDNKELQLIGDKFVFADPTTVKDENKVYIFSKRSSYPTYGVPSISINMSTKNSGTSWLGKDISVSNNSASTFYLLTNNSGLYKNLRLVAEGDQPSDDYEITNATGQNGTITSLTIKENAAIGTYRFIGYYNYDYSYSSSPVTFTITVKGPTKLVWAYGNSNALTEIDPDGYTVEWNPGQKFFNVAEKDPATGKLTKVHPQTITLSTTMTNGPLSYRNSSNNVKNGYGYGFGTTVSSVKYPCEVTYTAVSSLGFSVPDLRLIVTAMKPNFELTGTGDYQWEKDGTVSVRFSSPGLQSYNGSVSYIMGRLEPAFDIPETVEGDYPDGNFIKDKAKATVDRTVSSSITSYGIMNISGIPCSGRYNLILQYSGYKSNTQYVDPDYQSVIPLNIYPASDGLKLSIIGYDKNGVQPDNVIFTAPVENNTWSGPKDFDNVEADASAYRFVELHSDNVAGITGYYKAGEPAASVGTASASDAAPQGYSFTDKATGQYMNLFGVNNLSLYLAKNGAMTPTPMDITLEKSLPVVSGVESVTGETSDAPVEYFNLQGMRVDSPVQGQVYIRRQGSAASKIIFSKSN